MIFRRNTIILLLFNQNIGIELTMIEKNSYICSIHSLHFIRITFLKHTIMNIQKIMSSLEAKHPGESEYLQAVKEVLLSIEDIYNQHPEFEKAKII